MMVCCSCRCGNCRIFFLGCLQILGVCWGKHQTEDSEFRLIARKELFCSVRSCIYVFVPRFLHCIGMYWKQASLNCNICSLGCSSHAFTIVFPKTEYPSPYLHSQNLHGGCIHLTHRYVVIIPRWWYGFLVDVFCIPLKRLKRSKKTPSIEIAALDVQQCPTVPSQVPGKSQGAHGSHGEY